MGGVREIKGKLRYKAEAGAAFVSLFRVMRHNNATVYWVMYRVFEIKYQKEIPVGKISKRQSSRVLRQSLMVLECMHAKMFTQLLIIIIRSKALEIIFCAELAGPAFHTTNYKVGSPSLRRPWGIPPRIAMQDSSGS